MSRGRSVWFACLGVALFCAMACGKRPTSAPTSPSAPRPVPGSARTGAAEAPVDARNPGDELGPADGLRALRARAARRCHSGSAQLSAAGEAGSRCTVERGCIEARGKVSPSDGALTLECRGLACTCTFAPRRDKTNRRRIPFAIERPCGLSSGARAESLWLERCFPLLPGTTSGPPNDTHR